MNSPIDYRAKLLERYKQQGMSEEQASERVAKTVGLYMLQYSSLEEAVERAWLDEEARQKREESSRPETIELDSATEFIDAISPRGSYFHTANPGEWLFRGQSNTAWPMLPTALRPRTLLPDPSDRTWGRIDPDSLTNDAQVKRELIALREFYWRADRSGLAIPGDTIELRQLFAGGDNHHLVASLVSNGESAYYWPQSKFIPLMAFAQHHGLPTRLLDWTRNAYVAAYFAAQEAASWHMEPSSMPKGPPVTHLAVWAFKRSHAFESFDQFFGRSRSTDIIEQSAPAATNRNLHAQEGLFLIHRRQLVGKDKVQTIPFEHLILEHISQTQSVAETRFYSFRLKISEAPKLLYGLFRLGIDAASLFPGGNGVVDSLKERAWWGK